MSDLPDGYVAHPAADLFPLLTGDALKALTADIKANGLRQAIALDADGLVVDGRNRLIACDKAGVDPRFATTDTSPLDLVVSMNVKRRMLNKSQLAILAAKALPMYREEAAKRQTSGKKLPKAMPKGKAVTLVGKAFGVSGEYVRQAEKVVKRRPDLADEIMNLSEEDVAGPGHGQTLFWAYWEVTEPERKQRDAERRAEAQAEQEQRRERRSEFAGSLLMAEVAFGTNEDIRTQVELGVMTPEEALEEHADRAALADTIIGYSERLEERLAALPDLADVAERLHSTVDDPRFSAGRVANCGRLLVHLAKEWEKLL